MYRQIALPDEDKDFHRNLWRDSPSEPLKHLRMTRVTYEIASSSYHSIRCLQEVGKKSSDEDVKTDIFNDFYADDFIGGAPDRRSIIFRTSVDYRIEEAWIRTTEIDNQ